MIKNTKASSSPDVPETYCPITASQPPLMKTHSLEADHSKDMMPSKMMGGDKKVPYKQNRNIFITTFALRN